MKENGQPVDNDFALEVFYKERKGFLLAWFGEMHMDDVLAEIQKDEAHLCGWFVAHRLIPPKHGTHFMIDSYCVRFTVLLIEFVI